VPSPSVVSDASHWTQPGDTTADTSLRHIPMYPTARVLRAPSHAPLNTPRPILAPPRTHVFRPRPAQALARQFVPCRRQQVDKRRRDDDAGTKELGESAESISAVAPLYIFARLGFARAIRLTRTLVEG
jgi:hypothetical protein